MYKLLYASRLADYGLASPALHYCEAIGTALLSQGESDHPVLLVELIKVSFSKGSLQVFYLRCSEKAIVKAASTPQPISFEHAGKLEPMAVLDHVRMPRHDKQSPDTTQRSRQWAGVVGSGGLESRRVLCQEFILASAFLGQ